MQILIEEAIIGLYNSFIFANKSMAILVWYDEAMNGKNSDTAIFQVADAFNITDRGCVVTGELKQGVFRTGDKAILYRNGIVIIEVEIIGIEMFSHPYSPSLLLRGICKDNVMKNDCIIGVSYVK